MLLATLIAIPAGIISAVRRYSWLDYCITGFSLFGVSMPSFWFGILLILVFSLWLGWLPASGYVPWSRGVWPHLRSLLLPGAALGFFTGALARFSRASLVETLVQDYVRTARAKGLSQRQVVIGHALRNALVPDCYGLGDPFRRLARRCGDHRNGLCFSWRRHHVAHCRQPARLSGGHGCNLVHCPALYPHQPAG